MRTGLLAEVPSRQFCERLAAVPALAEAFKDSALVWWENECDGWTIWERADLVPDTGIPAPTVREMLVWLKVDVDDGYMYVFDDRGRLVLSTPADAITNPDALAEACLEAAKERR